MKFAKTLAMLAMLIAPAAHAGGDQAPQPAMKPNLGEFNLETTALKFPSGLTVLIQEDHSHPIVNIYKYVGHGFNDDPEGAEETAHFVEHTWFRSVHGEMPPIMFMIQDLGTMFNATTAADRTDYRTTANVKYLPILLKLESLRMTDFYRGVTEEQVTVEREVIRNEWRRRNEQSTSILLDFANEVIYPEGHPYARRSTHESLNNIKLETLQNYVDTYYVPEDTTITIVGDFKTDELISMILENFDLRLLHPMLTEEFQDDPANEEFIAALLDYRLKAGIEAPPEEDTEAWAKLQEDPSNWQLFMRNPDNPEDPNDIQWFVHNFTDKGLLPSRIPAQREEPPPLGNPEPVRREGPVNKTGVIVGWSLPAGYHDDHFNLTMLGQVATNYVQRGLSINFGKDVDLSETGCFAQPQLHATTLLCGTDLANNKLDPVNVAEKMIDQMVMIADPEQAQWFDMSFSRGKQESLKQQLESMDVVAAVFGARPEYIGEYAHWTGDPAYYKTAINNIVNVDGQKMGQLAMKYLKRDRAAVLIVDPIKTSDIDVSSADSSYGGASKDDALIEASDDLRLADRDAIAESYAKPDLGKLVDTKLDNGMRVVILPHGVAPKVVATVIFGGGDAVEPYGIHNFAARFTQSEGYDPLKIAGTPHYYFEPPYLGLSEATAKPLWGQSGETSFQLGMTAPAGNLDGALWILRAELESTDPYLSGKGSWMKSRYKGLKRSWFQTSWHQRQLQTNHLYPGDPRYASTTWEDLDAQGEWGNDQVKTYIDDHLHPENATLLIVGAVDPSVALEQAKKYWGGFKAPASSAKAKAPELKMPAMPTEGARTVIFDDEKRTQTQTNLACRLDTKGLEDRSAASVLGRMLGNQILANIRVKEGLAYSPGGFAWVDDDGSGMLVFQSLSVNRGVGRTVEFFKHAIERIETGDIDPDEVKLHQLRINRSGGVGNQTVEQMGGMLANAIINGRTWDEVGKAGERVADVKPEDLQRLVGGCLDHAFISLEGPKDVVTKQLDELGYGYEIYDYEEAGMDLLWKYDKKAAKKKQKAKDKADKKKEEEEAEEGESDDSAADATEE